jgi:hypothetical protein
MTGDFFAVGLAEWHAAIAKGMNPAVAYLVLARFSDRENRRTRASVHAIEQYTSISRGRAQQAIVLLEGARLAKNVGTKSAPIYDLTPIKRTGERELVWLPNTLVDGVGVDDIHGPVEQLRAFQDVPTLRLFIDLYAEQDLAEESGVKRSILWRSFDRERLADRGAYTIWGWREGSPWVRWGSRVVDVHRIAPTEEQRSKGMTAATELFRRLERITDSGLARWAPHVMECDGPEAEPILSISRPRRSGDRTSIEDRIWAAAYDAAHALLHEGAEIRADERGHDYRIPLPRGQDNVALVGVLRLLHRPRTAKTSAWWADYMARAEKWLTRFEALKSGAPATLRAKSA